MNSDIEKEAPKVKERGKGFIKAVEAIALVTIVLVSGFLAYSTLFPGSQTSQTLKAAIVDQLSIKYPNNTFIQTITSILANAGFTVDYYDNSRVTVEFYRNLPTYSYDLIVLRIHSITHDPEVANYTGLFTIEPWDDTKYAYEKATDQILGAAFMPYHEGDAVYFAITSEFVRLSMSGKFNSTVVVMMGCSSLTYTDMAETFIEKGARVCVGWNDSVLTTHTDYGITQLLKHSITEKQTVGQATTETNEEVGPDPESNSALTYYPPEAEDYVIPTANNSLETNTLGTAGVHEWIRTHVLESHEKQKHRALMASCAEQARELNLFIF